MGALMIGHNSAAMGQDLRSDLEDILNGDPEHLFIFAQWHIGDYIIGTQGMSLEQEGAYQRFLMRLYARGKPLPDNDGIMAAIMSLSTRVWRRIKTALIEAGKIVVRAGCLTNKRFEQERLKRAEQLRKRSLAAQTRWRMERENAAEIRIENVDSSPKFSPSLTETCKTEAPVSPKFAGSLSEVCQKLSENNQEKVNKINEKQHASAYANQYPLTKRRKEEGEAPPCAGALTRKIANPPHWAYNASFDTEERKAQCDVGWTEESTIIAMNGFEAQLLRDFPRVNFVAGLAAATGNQLPAKDKTTAKQVKAAVIRQFGFMEQDEAGRDRRAAMRATSQQQTSKTTGKIPPRDGCPDGTWQLRLDSWLQKGTITKAEAEAAGWRPC